MWKIGEEITSQSRKPRGLSQGQSFDKGESHWRSCQGFSWWPGVVFVSGTRQARYTRSSSSSEHLYGNTNSSSTLSIEAFGMLLERNNGVQYGVFFSNCDFGTRLEDH